MPDLRDARAAIRAFVDARGWEPFHDPKNLAMAVASEAGELVAELRWVASEEADAFAERPDVRARLEDEAADVAITLLMFCDRVGIDLETAIPRKLDKNAGRYPEDGAMFLAFEEVDWELMPWSARRALDEAGRRMSLSAWRALPGPERRRLAGLGVGEVDAAAVRALALGAEHIEAWRAPAQPPEGLDAAEWSALSPVARHALHAYARRDKLDRMREAYEALTSSGASQSTR